MPYYTKTQEPYAILLERNDWKVKKDHIMQRDGFLCTHCGRSAEEVELQVHHKHYIEGRDPWEYYDSELVTLCGECHRAYHERYTVPFYIEINGEMHEVHREPCTRCHGAGYFPEYRHVEGGVCFRCWGQRYEESIEAVETYAQEHNVSLEELFDGFKPLDSEALSMLLGRQVQILHIDYCPSRLPSERVAIVIQTGQVIPAFADHSLDGDESSHIFELLDAKYRLATRKDGSKYLIVKGIPKLRCFKNGNVR